MSNENFYNRFHMNLNLDISNRCPLECPLCARQRAFRNFGKPVPGFDLPMETLDKIIEKFPKISFCGQYSDPIHHPKFIEILEKIYKKNQYAEVHVASSAKPFDWYIKAFKANPDASWVFGIDGWPPKESAQYRINQDGQKLFDIMLESKKYLSKAPTWQFIIFSFNEDYVDDVIQAAKDNEIILDIVNSARFNGESEWMRPKRRI